MPDSGKSSRRAFLSGRTAIDVLSGPPQPLPPPASVGVQAGSHLLSVSREAMACLFEIVLDAASYRDKTDAAIAALDLVDLLESQLTVYRETSEVTDINRRAGREPVVVEEGLYQLLKRAAAMSDETQGAFDITAGRLSKIWGFYRRQGSMPTPEDVEQALKTVGSQYLQFDDSAHSVRFLQPGLEFNLGAIGKGYTLDRAADSLAASGINDFLIHGGNSSVLARGNRILDFGMLISDAEDDLEQQSKIQNPKSKIASSWSIALRHPLKPDDRLAEFFLYDQALGTSGSGTQFFHYQGKRYGHIIDPRSGWPAEQMLSATVIAPTAEQADALSTAFYVMGIEPARAFCERHPDIAGLLATQTGFPGSIELHPLNLSEDRWRRIT
jgi:thiamine biosynthesis lipoprotein